MSSIIYPVDNMDPRENRYNMVMRSLGKIKGHNQHLIQKFEDISYFFKNSRNIGFAADVFIQSVEIDDNPVALKVIKLSKAEADKVNFRKTSDINKLGIKAIETPRSAGFNIWREVLCMETMSPHHSGLPHYPYFYGFFMAKWADVMIKDMYLHDKDSDKKYKTYLKSREDTHICIILIMELFDYDLIGWTDRRHTFDEWISIYTQVFKAIRGISGFNIVHNDTHDKNFLVKNVGGDWVVVLADFGSNLSTMYDLNSAEKMLYKKLRNHNRDLRVFLYIFDRFNIAVYHFGKLKRMQTVDLVKDKYPDLIIDLQKKLKKPPEHTLFWIALSEVMAHNLEYFGDLIDIQKLPPIEINNVLDVEWKRINKSKKPYDIEKIITSIEKTKVSV